MAGESRKSETPPSAMTGEVLDYLEAKLRVMANLITDLQHNIASHREAERNTDNGK